MDRIAKLCADAVLEWNHYTNQNVWDGELYARAIGKVARAVRETGMPWDMVWARGEEELRAQMGEEG